MFILEERLLKKNIEVDHTSTNPHVIAADFI